MFKLFNSGLILGLFWAFLAQFGHFWEPKGLFLSLVWGQKSFLEYTCINAQLSFYSVSCVQTISFSNFWVVFEPFWALQGYFWGQDEAQNCFGVYSYRLITFVLQAWLKSTSFILFRTAGWLGGRRVATPGEFGFNSPTVVGFWLRLSLAKMKVV